ncbi:MAG: hypothetical protein VKM01_02460 [Cyanobacteriota bacterium]|jgi:hypothetical protein|nr:hypothetical protein [Cyanobacteriota bacterium]
MGCPKCRCLLSARCELRGRLVCANCGTLLPSAASEDSKPVLGVIQRVQAGLILVVMAGVAVSMALAGAGLPGASGPEAQQASQER